MPAGDVRGLFVALHGAGGQARSALTAGRPRRAAGLVVLAPKSAGSTGRGPRRQRPGRPPRWQRPGRRPCPQPLDPDRLSVGGFSDGASYALTLGLANGDVFRRVVAFSPASRRPTPPRQAGVLRQPRGPGRRAGHPADQPAAGAGWRDGSTSCTVSSTGRHVVPPSWRPRPRSGCRHDRQVASSSASGSGAPEQPVGGPGGAQRTDEVARAAVAADRDQPRLRLGQHRQVVGREADDARPAVLDGRGGADVLAQQPLEVGLHRGGGRGLGRPLRLAADVAAAAQRDAAVGQLLPVVEAVARVDRARHRDVVGRRGGQHLQAGRAHPSGERRHQVLEAAVDRDQHAPARGDGAAPPCAPTAASPGTGLSPCRRAPAARAAVGERPGAHQRLERRVLRGTAGRGPRVRRTPRPGGRRCASRRAGRRSRRPPRASARRARCRPGGRRPGAPSTAASRASRVSRYSRVARSCADPGGDLVVRLGEPAEQEPAVAARMRPRRARPRRPRRRRRPPRPGGGRGQPGGPEADDDDVGRDGLAQGGQGGCRPVRVARQTVVPGVALTPHASDASGAGGYGRSGRFGSWGRDALGLDAVALALLRVEQHADVALVGPQGTGAAPASEGVAAATA